MIIIRINICLLLILSYIRTLVAPIELMTNTKAYFVGKPNPLIMSQAMNTLKTQHADTVIIGDRMDTDIQAG